MPSILPKPLTLLLALALPLAGGASSLRAQTFAAPLQATGSAPVDFEFRADGTLIAKGAAGTGSLLSADQGAGARLLWYPALAAFRAGSVSTNSPTVWDLASLGQGSAAFGLDTTASGYGSAAFGYRTKATGSRSAAFGSNNTASGGFSAVFGYGSTASGGAAFVAGINSTASGETAAAIGTFCLASGTCSLSAGDATTASGFAAAAFGNSTTAAAAFSFAVGNYNVGGGNPTSWVASDPLFEVGNGTYSARSNAFTVRKNGDAEVAGKLKVAGAIRVAPQGDLAMGSFTAEPSPAP